MNHVDGVIDVKDLFAELIRKAWLIILCAVLFAGALGGYAILQNKQAAESGKDIESVLKEEELETADDYVMSVLEFYNLEDYLNESIMMSGNPYNLYQTELQYVITGDVAESDVATIRTCYENYVLYGQLMNDIAKLDEDYDGKVLLDALTIDKESNLTTDSSKIVSILVYAKDAKQSEELVSYVQSQIEGYSQDVKKEFGSHNLSFMNAASIQVVDLDMILAKETIKTNKELVEAEVAALGGQLNPAQKKYAFEILKESLDKDALKELNLEAAVVSGNTVGVVKYVLLGGAVGCALAIGLVVALYFFTSQIKSEKEIEHLYGIRHLGNCPVYKGNAFDKLADQILFKTKMYDVDTAKEKLLVELVSLCKEHQITELGIAGKVDGPAEIIIDELAARLAESDVKVVCMKNSSEDLARLPKNMIGIEHIKKTTMQEVVETIEACNENSITMLGYITFSK